MGAVYSGATAESYGLHFDFGRFQQGLKSTVYLNAPAGFQYYGDPGFPNGTAGVNKTWAQFSPRLGFAWT